jgi:CubicO group peptidase (beta-lactamase class C family)
MSRHIPAIVCFCLIWLVTAPAAGSEPLPRAAAADQQVDATALAAAFDAAEQLGYVGGMVVARDGHVIGEEHWGWAPTARHQSRSVTKSVTSLLIGIAIDQGYFKDGIYSRMVDYLPDDLVPADPDKAEIRIAQLLTMTSGWEWDDDFDVGPWLNSPDPVRDILDRPLVSQPGTRFTYNTAAAHLLSVMLAETTGLSTLEFADTYLFGPLGITSRSWQVTGGYHNGGTGLFLRTEDLAKLGVLTLAGGRWGGEQVVSSWWINASAFPWVRNTGIFGGLTERHYGFLWWPGTGNDHDLHMALGYGGQFIVCVPSLELVVAVHADSENLMATTAGRQSDAILEIIVDRILPATTDRRVFTATGLDVPELEAVDDMMRELMYDYEIRDSTVAITKDGRLVYARGFTLGEPEIEPVQPTALYRIGSIAKSVTSTAIHQLVEQGRLNYDTAVAQTLDLQPLPGQTTDPFLEEVSVDHLLTHTSGMYSENDIYMVSDKVAAAVGAGPPPTNGELLSYIVSHPFLFEPGTSWDYNNYGYITLDMMLQHFTGEHFVEYLLDKMFRPVGVGRARLAHRLRSELAPTEVEYDGIEGDPYKSPMENGPSGGGLVMAAPDLARLYSILFDEPDVGGLMTPATRNDMLGLPFPASEQLGYGRGWSHESFLNDAMNAPLGSFTDPDDGLEVYGHGSGGSGTLHIALWRTDGVGLVIFTNKDPVADAIDFPVIAVWPDHDLWDSVGVSLDPVGSAPTEVWIPVVAHTGGVGTSQWRSDLGLLNRSTLLNRVRLRLYGDDGYSDRNLVLAVGEYHTEADVMALFGAEGSGPLRVFSSEPLTVTSRTFNQTAGGTYGQFYDSATPTTGLETGETVTLMQLQENPSFRTNIGIMNGWKRPAQIEIELYDRNGSLVAVIEEEVPPEQTVQVNRPFKRAGGRMDINSGYALLRVVFGQHVLAYGSVVDNTTNDPTTMPSKPGWGSTDQWVAASAHSPGEHGSLWRTDLAVLNLSGSAAVVEITLHDGSGATEALSIQLADGEQTLVEDVVASAGLEGSAAIEVVSNTPVMVSSRTYNLDAGGTFGQLFDGFGPQERADARDTVWLSQLRQNVTARTNIGLLNTGDADAGVTVRLFDSGGTELASKMRRLAPGERVQLQEPFDRLAGRDDLDNGYATVEVRFGTGVIAYASVVDNATNDPTTVPMKF